MKTSYRDFVKTMMSERPPNVRPSEFMKTIAKKWKLIKKGGFLEGYNYDSGFYNDNNCGENMPIKCAPPPPKTATGIKRLRPKTAPIMLPPYDV
jgi:hypothetical protein